MDDVTDQELLARHLAGDRDEAFRQLVQRHSGLVYHAARRIVGTHEAAQDVTQTVFILLSTKADTLREHRSLAGWLYRSATFVARSSPGAHCLLVPSCPSILALQYPWDSPNGRGLCSSTSFAEAWAPHEKSHSKKGSQRL